MDFFHCDIQQSYSHMALALAGQKICPRASVRCRRPGVRHSPNIAWSGINVRVANTNKLRNSADASYSSVITLRIKQLNVGLSFHISSDVSWNQAQPLVPQFIMFDAAEDMSETSAARRVSRLVQEQHCGA